MMNKKGFTLVQALVSLAIFGMVAPLASVVYINNMQNYRYTKIKNELAADAKFIIERIAKEFQDSTIDYEEYYNQMVLDGNFGENYGMYSKKFHNGNLNTGQNPPLGVYSESDQLDATAVCDPSVNPKQGCLSPIVDYWDFDELYLITGDGKDKTIFLTQEGVLTYLKMTGLDEDSNGVFDKYICSGETSCPDSEKPALADFLPLSPARTEIKRLKFYISPIEDPYKAFAESDPSVQIQPHVTIYLNARPPEDNTAGLNKIPTLELQTTITSRVYHEVISYVPAI